VARALNPAALNEPVHFAQGSDPVDDPSRVVPPHSWWLDTSSEPYVLKRRNTANDAWVVLGTPGSVEWGAITGTLGDQADLQTALDGKSASGHGHVNPGVEIMAAGVSIATGITQLDFYPAGGLDVAGAAGYGIITLELGFGPGEAAPGDEMLALLGDKQNLDEKSVADGYASLDGTTKVPTAELGTGTADSGKFLRGDRAWETPPDTGSRLLGANTSVPAGNTLSNHTAVTQFASTITIPANTLTAGRVLRIKAAGVYGTRATSDTLTLHIRLPSGTTFDSAGYNTTVSLTNRGWSLEYDLVCHSTGAAGVVEAQGMIRWHTSAKLADHVDVENTATKTLDTTIAHTLALAAQWDVAAVANTVTLRQLIAEVL
jgi:hypothetical protein